MEQLAGQVIAVLVSYAADKGAKLAIEGGQAAIDAAQALFHKVIDRLKGDPAQASNADKFGTNPEGYKAPIEDALREQLDHDPQFADQIANLLDSLRTKAPSTFSLIVTGSGAAAAAGGVAAGQGGAAAGPGGVAWVGPTPPVVDKTDSRADD